MTLPVPVPRTWAPGDTDTAALRNTNLRDGVNFVLGKPEAYMLQTAAQTITTGTWTALAFDTNVIDNYAGHSTITNNSRYTAQVAGTYRCSGLLVITSSAQTHRLGIYKNAAQYSGAYATPSNAATALSAGDVSMPPILVPMVVGDFVDLRCFQDSGGNLATVASAGRESSFTVEWAST